MIIQFAQVLTGNCHSEVIEAERRVPKNLLLNERQIPRFPRDDNFLNEPDDQIPVYDFKFPAEPNELIDFN